MWEKGRSVGSGSFAVQITGAMLWTVVLQRILDSQSAAVRHVRVAGVIEGWSLLVLVFVAMPLKYLGGWPVAVQWVGWIHGVLFLIFCLCLLRVMLVARWSLWRGALVFAAGLVPFGPFIVDRRLRLEEAQAAKAAEAGATEATAEASMNAR